MLAPFRVSLPCRDLGWIWPMGVAAGTATLVLFGPLMINLVKAVMDQPPGLTSWAWAGSGVIVWACAVLVTLAVRARSRHARAEIVIDAADRSITVNGVRTDVRDGVSVGRAAHAVVHRSRVLVFDDAGRVVWQLSHLHRSHARWLAIELSAQLGLFAHAKLGRVPDGDTKEGTRSVFVPGVHHVDVTIWSTPATRTVGTSMIGVMVPMMSMMGNPSFVKSGASLGAVLLPLTLSVALLLAGASPIRIRLQIRADMLVVRTGTFWLRDERVAVKDLHPPRLVADGDRASLILASGSGFLLEIVGRPRRELEKLAWWIDHARGEAVPALPAPPPEMPEELERLRERVRVTTR